MNVDLNCDMGEGMPHDAALMPFISSANIACGYHAGDKNTMRRTVELCIQHSVAIGAHPGFQDKPNFGRNPIQLSQKALYDLIMNQLHDLNEICKVEGAVLHHVKPHGALYNMAASDKEMSKTIALAVFDFNPKLIYYGLSGSVMLEETKRFGLQIAHEVFADRTYQLDGSLTPRSDDRALIKDESIAMKQVLRMINEGKVETVDHTFIPIQADTICIHGDGEFAVQFAKSIHQQLKQEGIIIQSIQNTL
jgi:UPF0271 protein